MISPGEDLWMHASKQQVHVPWARQITPSRVWRDVCQTTAPFDPANEPTTFTRYHSLESDLNPGDIALRYELK